MNIKDKIRKITVLSYLDNNMVNICVEDVYKIHHVMSRKLYTSSLGQYVKIDNKRIYINRKRELEDEIKFKKLDKLMEEYFIAVKVCNETRIKEIEGSISKMGFEPLGIQLMTLLQE